MKLKKNKNQIHVTFLGLACFSFIIGIILASYINLNFTFFYILALCCLVILIFLKKLSVADYLIVLMFLFIGCLHQINFATLKSEDIYHLSRLKLGEVSVAGRVASQIQKGPFDKSFVFQADTIKTADFTRPVSGKVYVRFNKRVDLDYGERLSIEGKLSYLKDKNYFNQRLIRQGIRSVLFVGRRDWITKEGLSSFSLQKLAFDIKEELKQRLSQINYPAEEFLIAFILGDRSGLTKEIYSVFKYTGTVHILAISGLHIGIIIFVLLVFLKALRIKFTARFIFTITFLLLYSFMTGLRPSVLRAVIMGTTFLLSFIVKREYHIYNSLSLAAMIILAIWPWQIFDIGFQLSFISVLSIIFISPKMISILPKVKNRFINVLEISLVVSTSAWLGVTPLVAYYFGIISLISFMANVFIVLFIPFIIAAGFIYLLMSFLMPFLTKWLALSLEFMIGVLIYLVVFFKSMPFAYFYVDRFPAYILLVYYGLLIIFLPKLFASKWLSQRFQK